ncbi:hypothetical protein B9Z65_5529 [Elsinoe australis]|uniref:Putative phospholipase n=1 Tax=Elsinoe australis TaxID=40998 RepID=A0A2P7ZEG9_9PEZI|nr:hypothetical protein B9Z65_5529 [Elsinoe australis]
MIRLPLILRPRLTWQYILLSLIILYITYCFLFSLPLLSTNLPPYSGPHGVGTIDLEIPVQHRQISPVVFKSTSEPAFELKTVLFSLYYPAEKGAKSSLPKHYWIPPPIALTAQGYARFAHISNFFTNALFTVALWAIAGGNRIPAEVDVNLLRGGKYPVVVFSHGMASTRTDYTQWCGELASRGYVVAAIEHRDGSAPGSVVMTGGKDEWRFHMKAEELRVGEKEMDTDGMKKVQLDMRQAEVEETVKVLEAINEGRKIDIKARKEGSELARWQGHLETRDMTIAGHSYGATLALQTLKGGPTEDLPFKGAIVLDPGKQSGRLNDDVRVPALTVHSQSWSKTHSIFYGRPHFEVVKELTEGILNRGKDAWFVTSLGTSHPSVTDAPLIEPLLLSWTTGATINVREGVHQYVDVSASFLKYQHEGTVSGLLTKSVDAPAFGEPLDGARTGKHAYEKYWQIHVSPSR